MQEIKIRELLQKMEENNKKYNLDKKEWEKQMAVLDLKSKQQNTQIEELTKKEKSDTAAWSVERNTITGQVREITQRNEREKEELKLKLREFENKNN